MWGSKSCEHTCLGHNAKEPTRNDYFIVNESCLPLVKGFRVLHQEGFLAHSVLQIKMEAAQVVTAYEEPKKPKSIFELSRTKSWKDWKAKEPEEAKEIQEEDLPEKIWNATKEIFHNKLDEDLKQKQATFNWWLKQGDATRFWELWSSTFENALLKICGVERESSKP